MTKRFLIYRLCFPYTYRHAHLPEPIHFDYETTPDNELSLYTKARFRGWQATLSRPVLYHVLHRQRSGRTAHSATTEGTDEADDLARAQIIAQHCVSTSAAIIMEVTVQSRHGGIWMVCRAVFACSLIVLASVLGSDVVEPPQDWRHILQVAYDMLLKWSSEAADVDWMRAILLHVFDSVCSQEQLRS